jgi:hypothetical protein
LGVTVDEFRDLVGSKVRDHPKWFALESDPAASVEAVGQAEARLGVRFPSEFREFLISYGGGYFAFTNVFSVHHGSEWNIERRNQDLGLIRDGDGYLVFSDPGTGDHYAFRVTEKNCASEVWVYDHDEDSWAIAFGDLFEFLREVGLTP